MGLRLRSRLGGCLLPGGIETARQASVRRGGVFVELA